MNFIWVQYGSEQWKRMTNVVYLDYMGNKVPYGWITWETEVMQDGTKMAKMVWTRF
jgi:hypothetical protein